MFFVQETYQSCGVIYQPVRPSLINQNYKLGNGSCGPTFPFLCSSLFTACAVLINNNNPCEWSHRNGWHASPHDIPSAQGMMDGRGTGLHFHQNTGMPLTTGPLMHCTCCWHLRRNVCVGLAIIDPCLQVQIDV